MCRLPGVTTAIRLDVHFWWNIGEIALLLPAADHFCAPASPWIEDPAEQRTAPRLQATQTTW